MSWIAILGILAAAVVIGLVAILTLRFLHTRTAKDLAEEMKASFGSLSLEALSKFLDIAKARLDSDRAVSAQELDATVAAELQLKNDATVLRVVRLRLADEIPVMVETMHISTNRFPGIQDLDLETSSLYQALRERYGVQIVQLREALEPVLLNRDDAQLLGTLKGSLSIQATITSFDVKGQPIEHTISRVRGDSSQYYIEVGDGKSASRVRLRQPQLEVSLG